MPPRKVRAEAGKENGDIAMLDGEKAGAKRNSNGEKNSSAFKKKRKDTDDAPTDCEMVGSGRQAAQNLTFREKHVRLNSRDDLLDTKEDVTCATESEALAQTAAGAPMVFTRRLGDFAIVDGDGEFEPLEAVAYSSKALYIRGIVYPRYGPINKATGRRIEQFGPLKSFSIDCIDKMAGVVVATQAATYTVIRPASSYKKMFSNLEGQAIILHGVVAALSPAHGGNPGASLEEVIAHLARSKVVKGFSTPREGLLVNGKFVLAQLCKMDADGGEKSSTVRLVDTEFARALSDALNGFKYVGAAQHTASSAGIVIRDMDKPETKTDEVENAASTGNDQLDADEDFARQLQAKMDAEARGRRPANQKDAQAYLKVSEAEIADDYPAPAAYRKEEEEMDELLLFDEELADVDPEYLPRRVLTDFSIYNADGLFASLELLPMWSGIDPDVELYASGVVVDDDGDFSGAQTLDAQASGSTGATASAAGAGGSTTPADIPGMRMFLSQIREWVVEFGADVLFISVRTDVAWYRLSVPAAQYAPWFGVPLKCARIATRILSMLSEAPRASKLSFMDIVKRLTADDPSDPTFISKKPATVERYLSVHAQILLSCFKSFPNKTIRECGFKVELARRLAMVRHSQLYRSIVKPRANVNRNPMRDRAAGARSKPMTATATVMVKSIWQAYFSASAGNEEGGPQDGEIANEVEEDVNEEENDEEETENALVSGTSKAAVSPASKAKSGKAAKAKARPASTTLAWHGEPTSTVGRTSFYVAFTIGEVRIALGDVISLEHHDEEDEEGLPTAPEDNSAEVVLSPLGLVQALWQTSAGAKFVQIRPLVRGVETVLGDAASNAELFLASSSPETYPLEDVVSKIDARRLERSWDAQLRMAHFAEDHALRLRNQLAVQEGLPLEMFWRRVYVPEEGMFRDAPRDLELGRRLREEDGTTDEEEEEEEGEVHALADGSGFTKNGVTYKIGDFMFVGPDIFDQLPEAQRAVELPEYLANSRFHKGSHIGLRAWGIGRLTKLGAAGSKKAFERGSTKLTSITLQRYWRPEDISAEAAYKAQSYYDVFAGDEHATMDIDDVVGPVRVIPTGYGTDISTFACVGTFNRKDKAYGPVPEDLPLPDDMISTGNVAKNAQFKDTGKGKGKATVQGIHAVSSNGVNSDGVALASMDIFAGCGGLSEGFHRAGAAHTKWAIEYEAPAAEAFRMNNPDATVFCNNCNVLLHAAMNKAGLSADCDASVEAIEASQALPASDIAALPKPGEVDFICGGPPCQGYSGMNRFNKGNWSMVQNSMVMAFLSYADFYRPRYFLLENVRNFVSHNKSFTFRLTLRTLLDMGYQVRFGVLNAGNFGVAQSRKRTFIWAAAPGEVLPDWPRLMHAFRTPQLTINLPGGVQYTAVPQTVGAPLRPITVRDAIGDLPHIENGHDLGEMSYTNPPISAFQRAVRGDCTVLTDHVSKTMNELNLERCRCIPKNCPGADWRVLEEVVKSDPSRELFKGQPLVPWCLPHTADRHNGWRGLFGRLDWLGHFPTSTTDPQPMGKVGQVFHPAQDRIVSVRECARAQGFPDRHRFAGTVQNKHRQVGNAVPPPLAAALGRELRKALERRIRDEVAAALEAQM